MSVTIIAVSVCAVLMITGAVSALLLRNLTAAVVLSGAVGLLASIIYLFLGSPDVAMTEAAIGSGLTTVVFLFSLSRIRKQAETAASDVAGENPGDTEASEEVLYD